jgi:hypothetical protein
MGLDSVEREGMLAVDAHQGNTWSAIPRGLHRGSKLTAFVVVVSQTRLSSLDDQLCMECGSLFPLSRRKLASGPGNRFTAHQPAGVLQSGGKLPHFRGASRQLRLPCSRASGTRQPEKPAIQRPWRGWPRLASGTGKADSSPCRSSARPREHGR